MKRLLILIVILFSSCIPEEKCTPWGTIEFYLDKDYGATMGIFVLEKRDDLEGYNHFKRRYIIEPDSTVFVEIYEQCERIAVDTIFNYPQVMDTSFCNDIIDWGCGVEFYVHIPDHIE